MPCALSFSEEFFAENDSRKEKVFALFHSTIVVNGGGQGVRAPFYSLNAAFS